MAESNLIVNEFLTFIQNKIDVLDELSLTQICVSHFSDDDVENGKSLLCNSCVETRRVQRKGEDKKKKNIRDIIKIFKETDPALQPTFVARDLNRLPPVSFDHVDVTKLLKDIVSMKTELSTLRSEVASKGELIMFQNNVSSELNDLRASISTALTKSTKDSKKTKGEESAVKPMTTPKKRTHDKPRPTPTFGPSDNQFVPAMHTPTYRDIVQDTNKAQMIINRKSISQKVHNTENDDSEFTLVERKKRAPRNNLCGTAQRACTITVADIPVFVYVSRLAKSTTAQDMLTYIRDMGQECCDVQALNQTVQHKSYVYRKRGCCPST